MTQSELVEWVFLKYRVKICRTSVLNILKNARNFMNGKCTSNNIKCKRRRSVKFPLFEEN
jgi:hypothetical protein